MSELNFRAYQREKAVSYAHQWALSRNPRYYDFENIGGDCTNFISQCIYAGTGVMNYTPTFGWYYINVNKRAPAWTSVEYIYNFLIDNKGVGTYAKEITMEEVEIGDVVQLIIDKPYFQHTPIVVSVGEKPTLDNILVAAHSYDCDNKPLSQFNIKAIRFLYIEGARDFPW